MKKVFFSLFLSCAIGALGQESNSLTDFNFESITNPAFILLDETPSQIETPDNIKSLALYLSNGFSNTNIAVEMNPYWYIDSKEPRSYKGYRGFQPSNDGEMKIDPFHGLQTDWSLSLAYLKKEFVGFEAERNVVAIGARTTIFKFYNDRRTDEINTIITEMRLGVKNELHAAFEVDYNIVNDENKIGSGTCAEIETNPDVLAAFYEYAEGYLQTEEAQALLKKLDIQGVTKEQLVDSYFKERCGIVERFVNNPKTIKPNFRLDGAIGYSYLFKENDINAATANRFASWLTADVGLRFNDRQYLHILAIGKYVDDGFQINDQGLFFTENFWDYGAKVELRFNRFSFSYEYLERSGDGAQFRSVGNITYQINTNLSLTGGFGKDFPKDENLISLLGINWGLDGYGDFFKSR